MARWTQFIVEYMQRHHIPLVKLDIKKVAEEVGKYLMEHCRVYHKKHYCPYLKDANFTVEGCEGFCTSKQHCTDGNAKAGGYER